MSAASRPSRVVAIHLATISALVFTLFASLLTPAAALAAAFAPGNIVVTRIGDGSAALTSAATAVFLDEYTPAGTLVQSIALPTADSGANQTLTQSGSATSGGGLSRSVDGRYLLLAGYDTAPGTASVTGTSSAAVNRIVARVDGAGTVDTTTRITDGFSGDNVRGVASDDGSRFWVAGNASTTANAGVRLVPFGNSAATTQITSAPTNTREPRIFNGQLYVTSGSGGFSGVNQVGSGLPTSTTTGALLPGITSGGNPYAYVLLDRDATVPGPDTLYVADQNLGLLKFSFDGTSWTARGSIAGNLTGLDGVVSGGNAQLYATSGSGANNSIVSITDTAAFNAPVSGSFTALTSAGANRVLRGLAFAPSAAIGPVAPTITTQPQGQTIASGGSATLTVSASGTAPLSYQWYQGNTGDTTTPVGTNSASFTTPALTATTSYWVQVSNSAGSANSATAVITVSATSDVTPPTVSAIAPLGNAISDPTNPTASFTVGDDTTPAASLNVAVTASSNTAVAPLANITLGGGGASRTLSVNPAAVGYSDITVTVTDAANNSASVTLSYAASAASQTPATSRYPYGASDSSTAVALDANFMVIADDEGQLLRVYNRSSSGLPVASFDATSALALTDSSGGVPREVDIESSARQGNTIYWLGSHSNASGGNNRPNRSRFFATTVSGTGAATTFTVTGFYGGLKTDLIAWDNANGHGLGAGYLGLAASAAPGVAPEAAGGGGFNIEGFEFAPDGTTGYLGFRAPLEPTTGRTKALIVPVLNVASLIGGSGPASFGAPIQLDLGGRGIREIRKSASSNDYVIIAGPATAGSDFKLYTWDGNPASAPVERGADLSGLASVGSPEAIVEVPAAPTASTVLQVIADNGDTVWYNDGVIAKDLPVSNFKKSRSDLIALGSAPVVITPIPAIQGAAQSSPLVPLPLNNNSTTFGQRVTTQGVVTFVTNTGFYIQNPTPDNNPATSEGLLIFNGSASKPAVGNLVQVDGFAAEFRPGCTSASCTPSSSGWDNLTTTELAGTSANPLTWTLLSAVGPTITPTVIGAGGRVPPTTTIEDDSASNVESGNTFDPATDGLDFYESLEGMLVQVNDAVAVGPTSGFGELPVLADNGAGAGLRTPRGGIIVADSYADFNPEIIYLDDTFGVTTPALNVADKLIGATRGILDYSFGLFKLNVLPGGFGTVTSGGLTRETVSLPAVTPNTLSVTSFNVENLGGNEAQAKFDALAAAIVNNLQSPDIIGVEEIQDNNGTTNDPVVDATTTYNRLTAAIAAAGGPTYSYRQIDPVDDQDGGAPGGNIRVGFLFRADRGLAFVDRPGGTSTAAVSVSNVSGKPQLSFSPGRIDPTNPAFNASRKPLAAEFTFRGQTLFAVVNHFNSKGGDDPLFGRFQPPVRSSEVQRQQQATILNNFVGQILAIDPNALVTVVGDLNDFEFSQVLGTVKGTQLKSLFDTLPKNERYTYVFNGNSQVLDHQLASAALFSKLVGYDVVHLNSEFADQISDHDPSVARYTIAPPQCSALCYADAVNGSDFNGGTSPSDAKQTIQAAIDTVSAGGAVEIAAGTYPEQVSIAKNVTINGAGQALTLITPPATLAENGPSPAGERVIALVDVTGGAQVKLGQVGVVGPLQATGCADAMTGVYVRGGAKLTLVSSTVKNIQLANAGTDLFGCQNGIGIRIGAYGGSSAGELVTDGVVVRDYQKGGVVVSGVGSKATLLRLETYGVGAETRIAQNGIQVSGGATATIDGALVRFNQCDNAVCGADPIAKTQASGIIIIGSGPVTVTNSTVRENDTGLYSAASGPVIVDGNLFTDNRYTGVTADEGTLTLRNNEITGSTLIGVAVVSFDAANYGVTQNSSANLTNNLVAVSGVAVKLQDEIATDGPRPVVTGALNSLGAVQNTTGGSVDLRNNWWGSTTGPTAASNPGGTGAAVSGPVQFSPWLCDGTDTSAARGFQPNAATKCGIAAQLVFSTQPGNGSESTPLNPQPVIRALDVDGNPAPGFGGAVSVALGSNPGGATLGGTVTVNAVSGTATFSNLLVSRAGFGYTLVASSSGLSGATSQPFNVLDSGFSCGPVLDAFSRGNANNLGGSWRGATNGYQIRSGQVANSGGGFVTWNPATFGADQKACITLTRVDTTGMEQSITLKSQAAGDWTRGVIDVNYINSGGRSFVRVDTFNPGRRGPFDGWFHLPETAVSFSNGDVLGARALADGTVRVYKNGVLLQIVDTRPDNGSFFVNKGGRIGIWYEFAKNGLFDNFAGGNAP